MRVELEDLKFKDEEIARLVQYGDTEQFGLLMERYESKLLRYGRKFLSDRENIEDLVQDIFIKAFQNIKGFDASKRFSPWIYRIAHNTFVNALKKNSRTPFMIELDTLVSHPVYEDPGETEREQSELKLMINKSLESISPKYKEVLILYYLEDLDYKEISEVLQVPTGTVGIRLRRAKEALKEVYKETH